MNESGFWVRLKPLLPGFAFRVENGAGTGNPDVQVLWQGRTFYLELKVSPCKSMTEDRALSLLRPSQKLWHYEAALQGVDVFTLVLYDESKTKCFSNYIKDRVLALKFTGSYTLDSILSKEVFDV